MKSCKNIIRVRVSLTPSLVETSEAGNGIGYTSFRSWGIRAAG